MFPQIIDKLCAGVSDNSQYHRSGMERSFTYISGFIDAMLDVLTMMGHKVSVECDEDIDGSVIYTDITVDGIQLVTDDTVDETAKLELLAAHKDKED